MRPQSMGPQYGDPLGHAQFQGMQGAVPSRAQTVGPQFGQLPSESVSGGGFGYGQQNQVAAPNTQASLYR